MQNNLLDILTREGVLINVNVRFWRAARRLKAEDLGLDPDNINAELISLGHKKLLPKKDLKEFALIESRAHAIVEANTFPFMDGLGHFLPNNKLDEVTTKLEQLEAEFNAAQAKFMDRYTVLRIKAARDWHRVAAKLVSDPDRLVAVIGASFPNPAQMGRYFGFETHLFQVSLPENIQAELISAGEAREIALARSQAVQQAEHKIQHGVEKFVQDAVATLRQETAKLCDEMLTSMESGKTKAVHQKTLNRLSNFIDHFKSLNFMNDQQLEEQLEEARRKLLSKSAEQYRGNDFAQGKLRRGIQRLGDKARELAKQDTEEIVERFGQMGRRKFNLAA